MKKSNKDLAAALVAAVIKLDIPVLFQELEELDNYRDNERYRNVINSLTSSKFRELVEYVCSCVQYPRLWGDSSDFCAGIKKELLDTLSPKLLIRIAAKCSSNTADAWGSYGRKKDELQDQSTECSNLSKYLFLSNTERIKEILEFLIQSCETVKAPRSEQERNIFVYTKHKQFPFEVVNMLVCIHPKVLFPAINLLSKKDFNRMFWLCRRFMGDNGCIENVLQQKWGKDYFFREGIYKCIGVHIHVFKDAYLMEFLREFSSEAQAVILPLIGKERIVQIHKNRLSIKNLNIPVEWEIYQDKESNERAIEQFEQHGLKALDRLSTRKKVELLGIVGP